MTASQCKGVSLNESFNRFKISSILEIVGDRIGSGSCSPCKPPCAQYSFYNVIGDSESSIFHS